MERLALVSGLCADLQRNRIYGLWEEQLLTEYS